MTYPFGTVIRSDNEVVTIVLMVLGPGVAVCLVDLPWKYVGEVMEFGGDDWEVLDGPYE